MIVKGTAFMPFNALAECVKIKLFKFVSLIITYIPRDTAITSATPIMSPAPAINESTISFSFSL